MATTNLSEILEGASVDLFSILSHCDYDKWLEGHGERCGIIADRRYGFYEVLECTSRSAYEAMNPDSSGVCCVLLKIIESSPLNFQYPFLIASVKELIIRQLMNINEFSLHGVFKANPGAYIPGASMSKYYSESGAQPDAIVSVDGKICPVEIKREKINDRAIEQAMRYKRIFNAETVYVLAPTLEAVLPEGVIYYKLSMPEQTVDTLSAVGKLKDVSLFGA